MSREEYSNCREQVQHHCLVTTARETRRYPIAQKLTVTMVRSWSAGELADRWSRGR
jgi:hypothetical protein